MATESRSARSRSLARGLSALAFIGTINLVAPIAAQAPSGVVTGTVTDPVGDVVPGITITLSGRPLNRPLTAITAMDGTFRLAGVPDGSFTLTAEYSAFKKITRRISVARGERVELPTIKMDLGAAAKPNVKELDLKPGEIPVEFKTSLGPLSLALDRRTAPGDTDALLKRVDALLYDGGNIEVFLSGDGRSGDAVEGLEFIERSPDPKQRFRVVLSNEALLNPVTRTTIGRLWNWRQSRTSSTVVSAIFRAPMVGRAFSPRVTIIHATRLILQTPTRPNLSDIPRLPPYGYPSPVERH